MKKDELMNNYEIIKVALEYYAEGWECLSVGERARKALEALEDMQWKPIETAPRDGTVIDLYIQGDFSFYRMTNCRWSVSHEYWVDLKGLPIRVMDGCPTHWMPLPAAPEGSENE